MLENFSFVVPRLLAGCARPGSSAPLQVDLQEMQANGIGVLVTLTESSFNPALIREAGLEYRHIPIVDFAPPTEAQFSEFVELVEQQRTLNKGAVLVHCAAGIGRTGSMLAAWFISQGKSAEEAIREVRLLRPASVETPAQIRALERWAARFSKSE